MEEEESLALPTLSPRLNWRNKEGKGEKGQNGGKYQAGQIKAESC